MPHLHALPIFLLAVNIIAFFAFGADKRRAMRGQWRISESTLLLLSAIGGSIGAIIGMKVWRHKTRHAKFIYGVPAILLIQAFLLIFICFNS